LVEGRNCSTNRACQALGLAKSTYYRKASVDKAAGRLEKRIEVLSLKHPRYGYRMITELLRAEDWKVNGKRVQRIRRREELQVVTKARKTRRKALRQTQRVCARRPNEVWSYDFIHDRLENGAALKMLTVLDEFTRECLGILVARSITASGVSGSWKCWFCNVERLEMCEATTVRNLWPMRLRSGPQSRQSAPTTSKLAVLGKTGMWKVSMANFGMSV
jgi:hypothetical protein